jgi:hypothetical protein
MNPEIITPENITDEQRDALAPQFNANVEAAAMDARRKFTSGIKRAVEAGDADELKRLRHAAKAFEAQLAKWNDGMGIRASDRLKALQQSFGELADDIFAALAGELPGQLESDPADDWKRDPQ